MAEFSSRGRSGCNPAHSEAAQTRDSLNRSSPDVFLAEFRELLAPSFVFELEALRIVAATESCGAVLRYDRSQLEKMLLSDLWPEDEVEWRKDFVKTTSAPGTPEAASGLALNLICGDGSTVDVEISYANVDLDGLRCRLVVLARMASSRPAYADYS